jgi:hypothetical protein
MTTTKSPKRVAEVALAAGKEAFRDHAHKFSPRKFTQPQLFACLVLKEFERKDYRGVCQLLKDWSDLRATLGLASVPHFTTLHKAAGRLLRLGHVRRLIAATLARVHGRRRVAVPIAAGDSSGFDARHASRYFVWRTSDKTGEKGPKKRVSYKRFGKLMVVVNTVTHAILAAVASVGPTPDIDQLDGVLAELPTSVAVRHMVLDAGFDSAHNHRLLREDLGIRSTIPPKAGRPPKDPSQLPTDKYRRLMKTRFNAKAYRRRGQVETVFSMLKRNLGSALRGRSHWSRFRDMYLRVITHNIMLVQ